MDEEKRPVCGCSKAECLRRYCECFSNMWFCSEECSCQGCRNTEDNEDEVEERAEIILKNKPDAFKPKIADDAASSAVGQELRRHVNGCTCSKSQCKKRYCECFKNEVGCTARCQCKGCGNSYGAKGETQQFDENGNSNGTASVTDNQMYWSTEATTMEDFAALGGPWDVDPHVQALGDGGLENMFLKHCGGGDYFRHNVHPQTHQWFAQADESPRNNANSTLQGPSNHDTCNVNTGSQSCLGRS